MREVGGGQHDECLLAQGAPLARLGDGIRRLEHERRVEFVRLDRGIEQCGIGRLNMHVDRRRLADQPGEDIGQHPAERRGARAEAQVSADRVVIGGVAQLGGIAQQLPRLAEDAPAALGHAHRAPDAHDQRRTQLAFERVELLRHGRGADVERARRRRHRAAIDHRDEGLQEVEIDGPSSCLRRMKRPIGTISPSSERVGAGKNRLAA